MGFQIAQSHHEVQIEPKTLVSSDPASRVYAEARTSLQTRTRSMSSLNFPKSKSEAEFALIMGEVVNECGIPSLAFKPPHPSIRIWPSREIRIWPVRDGVFGRAEADEAERHEILTGNGAISAERERARAF
ncbi:hypothetical protein [Microvirga makkahensis]|uniref:Uncharacterized protein n=1 Tax=Microvirga makkahensis TaxID=1128670 RepID=A0A7X3MW46_9HYPH|nr:hypothetical protein [Microvirga makkahensis]MXQ14035.1 hypothetical protein [Microvirga makkahensis]